MKIKENLKKIIFYMITLLAMVNMCFFISKADESLTVGMDQYRTDNGKVIVYVNSNHEQGIDIDKDNSFVVLGKQNLKIEDIKKFSEVNEPTTYMFMVDISGSMNKERIETIKTVIKKFLDNKKAGDNFCITTMGDELVSSGFLDDATTLGIFVDGIEVTNQDTDLYKSIKEELNILKTAKEVNQKRCLIILSDGADDQKDGITREEAETQVKDSHIPIFTVAFPKKNYGEKDLESAKILGSFARYSAGGAHYVPVLDNFEPVEVYNKITNVINNSSILYADLADATTADGDVYLGVNIVSGAENAKDGMQIPAGDILEAIKVAQELQVNVNISKPSKEEVAEVETSTVEEETVIEAEENNSNIVLIIIIVVAVIVIAVIILILVLNSKSKKVDEPVAGQNINGLNSSSNDSKTQGFGATPAQSPVNAKASSKLIKVTLFKIGPGIDESYELVLDSKKSIGRKAGCDLSFNSDTSLSGVHCYIYADSKKVIIQDNGSTNGTYLNGVPITDEHSVESGDILLIGSFEYRIVF